MADRCPVPGSDVPLDLTVAGGCRSYLERKGIIPALRAPMARTGPYWWKIRRIPQDVPLPLAELQRPLLNDPPCDGGQTREWPHPDFLPHVSEGA